MTNRIRNSIHWLSLAFLAAMVSVSAAAIDYSSIGSTYTQNFDALASSGTDLNWFNDSVGNGATIRGWSLYRVTNGNDAAPTPMNYYDASDGEVDNGRFYSFGRSGDRALGGIGHGTFGYPGDTANLVLPNAAAGWIAANITNNTGVLLTQFTLNYDGEQWRDAGDNEPPYAQTMVFQFGFGADFMSVASWNTPGGSFNFTSPVNTPVAGRVNGNTDGRVANLGGTITSLSWQPSTTLWLRWIEQNDPKFDHGLAIDNISFSANAEVAAVPEAPAILFGGLVCSVSGLAVISRRMLAWLHSKNSNTVAN